MKKLFCLILAMTFVFSMIACAPQGDVTPAESSSDIPESSSGIPETSEEPEPTETTPQIPFLKVKGVDISEYKIVYSAESKNEAKDQAERLAEYIESVFCREIEIIADPDAKLEKSIIISDTLPPISNTLVIDTVTAAIQDVDGDIWISATNKHTLAAAIDKIIADAAPATADAIVDLDYSGENKASVVAEELGELLKVMTYNVQTGTPDRQRQAAMIKNITDFMPDVIGTQEVNANWISIFKLKGLLNEYALVGEPRNGNKATDTSNGNEYSAILYRKSKFNLLASGTCWLSDTPDKPASKLDSSEYIRVMTYVVLERISDGAKFVHVNTHMSWDSKDAKTNLEQMKIIVKLVNERIYSKYGELPTYYTGDFNVSMTSEGYKYLISTGTEDSREVAEVSSDEKTFSGGSIIDYCIVTKGDFLVTSFDVGYGKPGSDHYPVYVEMYIIPQK